MRTAVLIVTLLAATAAQAELVGEHIGAIDKRTALIVQLSDMKARPGACPNGGTYRALVSATDTLTFPESVAYGEGCWTATASGKIMIFGRTFQGGREFSLVRSAADFRPGPGFTRWADFASGSGPVQQPANVRKLIDEEASLNDQCRGGSGDNPSTMAACDKREAVLRKIKAQGWCWGPDDAVGADKGWVRCRP